MVFNHPAFLYGLFALLIPIIIHLFNFRRYRKMMFSNIEFLKQITVQTKKQNELKQLLVLLTRLLAITAIVIAFADPRWERAGEEISENDKLSVIYVDNSFSMTAEGEEGRLFDRAASTAKTIVNEHPDDTRIVLLTNETGSSPRPMTKEAAISEIEQIDVSPSQRNLSSVLRTVNRVMVDNKAKGVASYLISDFQRNAFDFNQFPMDTSGIFYFIPMLHASTRNVYIDSCWVEQPFLLPGRPFDLHIGVSNASDNPLEKIPLKLSVNGLQKAAAGVDLEAEDRQTLKVTVVPDRIGWNYGIISLEDYPITFDDSYYFTFRVQSRIPVMVINGPDSGMSLLKFYVSDSTFDLTSTGYRNINYNVLDQFALIVLNSLPGYSSGLISQLKRYLENGGNVLFIPSHDGNRAEENLFLRAVNAGKIIAADTNSTRVVKIRESHPLFREVITAIPDNADLPMVNWHVRYQYAVSSGMESLATMLNGDDFLITRRVKKGNLFLLAVSLHPSSGNFATHPLFVPVMYGTALQGQTSRNLAYIVGKDITLETKQGRNQVGDLPYRLVRKSDGYTVIPEQMMMGSKFLLNTHDGITENGFYDLQLQDSIYHVFAYNYNRSESDQRFLTPEELEAELQQSGIRQFNVVGDTLETTGELAGILQKESDVWKLFIIFALLLLLAEIMILRFWK
ncbi:MAG: BatA and WFA domain-containing protein [bacterium]